MLAMVVKDNAGCQDASGVWATIASMLAPTGGRCIRRIVAFHLWPNDG